MKASGWLLACALLLIALVALAESKHSIAPTTTPFPFAPITTPTTAERAEEEFRVSFNITSCKDGDAKQFVNKGFFALHSFWYWKANDYFTNATEADPNCVMGYWGQAMQLWHPLWSGIAPINYAKARGLIKRAREVDPGIASDMEWKYIDSIEEFFGRNESDTRTMAEREEAYSIYMEILYHGTKNNSAVDVDTAAFYALSLVTIATRQDDGTPAGKSISENTRRLAVSVINVAELIDEEHPGLVHYNIHAYDTNTLAPLALDAADTYASIAPNVPHALHMPSHIYSRLGMWNESIESNIRSKDAALYWISVRDPEAVYDSDYTHAINFLSYGYLQLGNPKQSKFYIDDLEAVVTSGNYGSSDQERVVIANWLMEMKCSYLLESERYDEAAVIERLQSAPFCNSPACYYTQLQIVYTRVVGNSIIRDYDAIQREIDALEQLTSDMNGKKMSDEMKNYAHFSLKTAQAWQMYSTQNITGAIETMESILTDYNLDDAHSIPLIEPREVLGYFLLGDFDYEGAYQSYTESLDIDGQGRLISIYGAARSADLRGKEDDAVYYYSMFLDQCQLCVAYLKDPGANTTLSYNYKEKSKTAAKYLFDYEHKSNSDVDIPVASLVLIVLVTAAITALVTVYVCKRVRLWRDAETYKRQIDERV